MSKREEIRKRKQQQSRRQMLAIAGVIVVIAIGVTAYLIYQNYQNTLPVAEGSYTTVPTQTWPQADGKALGPPGAKALVQEFGDFRCPVCDEFYRSIEPQLLKDYVATGKIRYEFHHYLVIDQLQGGVESRRAAEASECANEQGRFWDYHNMLYANQYPETTSGGFADNRLKAFATALGLDSQKFNACFDAHKYSAAVDADIALGTSMGVQGTPTVFINGSQLDISTALNYSALKQQLDVLVGQ
jgi:protein-disulfide isomerase